VSDDEFVRAFLGGALPPAQFHHRDHVRLAWCLTRRLGEEAAGRTIGAAIREYATRHGQAGKYHETVTRFWVRIVAHHVAIGPDIAEFGGFLTAFPRLLDKTLPERHWRRETLDGAAARAGWVEPDLLALPA
jgi:hypothetical protein